MGSMGSQGVRHNLVTKQRQPKERDRGASLLLSVKDLPAMQGTQVWSLIGEKPTCHGATKRVHND